MQFYKFIYYFRCILIMQRVIKDIVLLNVKVDILMGIDLNNLEIIRSFIRIKIFSV